MAEEIHVLFGGMLPGRAALNRAMKELGFPFAISPSVTSLEGHSGYLPMKLRREETGIRVRDIFEGRTAVEEFAKDADPRFQRCGNFRWGGDENEMLAGLCTAATLAKLLDGNVLDDAENRLLTVDQAVEWAGQNSQGRLAAAGQAKRQAARYATHRHQALSHATAKRARRSRAGRAVAVYPAGAPPDARRISRPH